MINTQRSKEILAARRERRDMERAGYQMENLPLRTHWSHRVLDVRPGLDGRVLWLKLGPTPTPPEPVHRTRIGRVTLKGNSMPGRYAIAWVREDGAKYPCETQFDRIADKVWKRTTA
jgi:hypothetical protein